ncbi:hypothetical protein ACI77M_03885 [Pseudomonas fildesensis]
MNDVWMAASFIFTVWAIAASIDTGRDQYWLMALSGGCLIASFVVSA